MSRVDVEVDNNEESEGASRRQFMRLGGVAGSTMLLGKFVTGCATAGVATPARRSLLSVEGETIDLRIAKTRVGIAGRAATATTVNGGVPGPEIRLKEGQDVLLRVHNGMNVDTSIHWHGLLVPPGMDGVPGVSFPGIKPGATFEYQFPIRQAGTYWYHSHSGFQEQTGIYGPIVIEPREPETYDVQREYTIVLSDWTFEDPHRVFANLKRYGGYYNYQRRTMANLWDEAKEKGFWGALGSRFSWGRMRMDATDISDVTGATYTFLMNGLAPDENWRGLFKKGERIRLRFINASAATYFDVRIPGLPMQVIHADGMAVVPVETDEFRIAIAETLDVIVEPTGQAYTIFAEAMDRSGHARGTLATDTSASAQVPKRRPRPMLTMADMGMDHGKMSGMDHGKMSMDQEKPADSGSVDHSKMSGMDQQKPADSGSVDHSTMSGMDQKKPADSGSVDHGNMSGMDQQKPADSGSADSARVDHVKISGMDQKKPADSAKVDHSKKSGMDHVNMSGMDEGKEPADSGDMDHRKMSGMDEGKKPADSGGANSGEMDHSKMSGMDPKTNAPPMPDAMCRHNLDVMATHNGNEHGAGNTMVAKMSKSRITEPGVGLGKDGWRVLTYSQLRRAKPGVSGPPVTRTIELHLTGNMERYMWSFDGKQYDSDTPDIVLAHNERVRFVLINDTMMAHPIHIHGVFFELEVGACESNPLKHTVNVQPAERTSFVITANEVGRWAFHCHILYHMDAGMFRVVEVRA